ncbi:MAG: site-2 protease family protein [Candidatus Nanoarchaeia archaeon]
MLNIAAAVIFYLAFAIFLYIKRKNVEVQSKVIFLYRTERFNNLMKRIADWSPRFWRGFGYFAIPVGFIAMGAVLSLLLYQTWRILTTPDIGPQAQLLLPGPITQSVGPIQFISVWIFLFAILVIFIVHEGMHGIVANAWKLKIKNAGIGLMAIIPLAFVEPDEKQLQKKPLKVQLSVFAAGPMANFVAAAFLILLTFGIAPVAASLTDTLPGAKIDSAVADFPAAQSGLESGAVIIEANGRNVNSTQDLIEVLTAAKPGDTIILKSAEKTFEMKAVENPKNASKAYIGINFRQNFQYDQNLIAKLGEGFVSKLYGGLIALMNLFNITAILNLLIGAINLLPLGPIDGGRMAYSTLQKAMKSKAQKAFAFLTYLSLGLLLFNILGPYLWKLF